MSSPRLAGDVLDFRMPSVCRCGAALEVGTFVCLQCVAADERAEEERQEREALDLRQHRQDRIGIPARYRHASFADRPTPALERVRAYHAARGVSRGRALGLLGPTGVGKTHAACALVNELLDGLRGDQRFMLAGQLGRALSDFHMVDEAMVEATSTRLLVLDDVQIPARPEIATLLEEVLIVREAEGRPVMFTTNLTRQQFTAAFSDRIADRLRGWGELVELPGRSLRRAPESAS